MTRQRLSLATLDQFDYGKGALIFQKELEKVVRDLIDRPGDTTARTVDLQVILTPIVLQDGDVIDAKVQFKCRGKTPPYKTAARPAAIDRGRQLVFQPMAPDNPEQRTLDEAADLG